MKLPIDIFVKKGPQAKARVTLGLDVGSNSIKFVKLLQDKDAFQLVSYALEEKQLDLEEVFKKIIDPKDLKRPVTISVSGAPTIMRYVSFPKMNQQELKQALKFEAQKHIPFSIAEVNLDSCILKQDLPDNKMLVLVAAVKKEPLEQKLRVFKELNLLIHFIDIDALALINAFTFNYADTDVLKGKAVALLNIGALESNLDILEDGVPRLSRDIHIGGNHFTQKLADIFGADQKAAEKMKLSPDKEKTEQINAAAENVLVHLAKELRSSFDYYESQSVSSVSKIFLSGGSSLYMSLGSILTTMLGVPVERWDPFRRIILPDSADMSQLKSVAGQFAVAVGLALRT
ncbi:MAG: type IV pilus assembly protein PilM [Candidatus Omnitrophota bacterium]|jgi:type IV pilus assembly protein PilM|nr:MAG: type IV pilus assembly protein PilM [Candidatus Omnitrophota bacterium]